MMDNQLLGVLPGKVAEPARSQRSESSNSQRKLTENLVFKPLASEQIQHPFIKMQLQDTENRLRGDERKSGRRVQVALSEPTVTNNIQGRCQAEDQILMTQQATFIDKKKKRRVVKDIMEEKLIERSTEKQIQISKMKRSQLPEKLRVITSSESSLHKAKCFNTLNLRQEKISRDKEKNPSKYKILCSELGHRDEEVFQMKPATLAQGMDKFIRQKGLEYLRQNIDQAKGSKSSQRLRSQGNEIRISSSTREKDVHRNIIHEIFGEIQARHTQAKQQQPGRKKEEDRLRVYDKAQLLRQMKEKQEMLGKIVFQRVKKHLKEDSKKINYFKMVRSQETIDDALIDYLKTKIDRAESTLR